MRAGIWREETPANVHVQLQYISIVSPVPPPCPHAFHRYYPLPTRNTPIFGDFPKASMTGRWFCYFDGGKKKKKRGSVTYDPASGGSISTIYLLMARTTLLRLRRGGGGRIRELARWCVVVVCQLNHSPSSTRHGQSSPCRLSHFRSASSRQAKPSQPTAMAVQCLGRNSGVWVVCFV